MAFTSNPFEEEALHAAGLGDPDVIRGVRHLGMSDIECELPSAFTVTQPSTDHPGIASIGYSGMSEIGDVPRSSKIVGRAEVQIQRLIFSHLVNDWHLWNA